MRARRSFLMVFLIQNTQDRDSAVLRRLPCLSREHLLEKRRRSLTVEARGTSEDRMKALAYNGKGDMRCDTVPDPKIEHPRDAIIKVTACAICGSDLHIFDGVIPGMERGDILAMRVGAKWAKSAGRTKHWKLATGWSCPSPSPAANASFASAAFSPAASAREKRPRNCGAIRLPACSVTPSSRRIRGWTSGISPRALCRCRAT